MEKVLVEIFVPAAKRSFDVFVPPTSILSEVVSLVTRSVCELSEGKYNPDVTAILCDAQSGRIFNINLSLYELEIKTGSKLMLI